MSEDKKCKCLFCSQNFMPGNGITPEEHLAKGIIKVYREMQDSSEVNELPCLRCGDMKMRPVLAENALSRHAEVYICSECGVDESLRDAQNDVLPLTAWRVINELLKIRS